MADRGEEEDGILLYYEYTSVHDVAYLVNFYESNCQSLGLLGRVRVAPDGVNATLGGSMSSLEKHISAVKSKSFFEGTDFKLASSGCPSDIKVAEECGFTSLSVRVVKELVTFSASPLLKSPAISNAGKHLSATQFHSVLQDAESCLEYKDSREKKLLLLDARNIYETRIGKFQNPYVETLDPEIRQYSDLAAWIDNHSEKLRGKSIFMYCTGGIRCEMASAYIKSKGAGYENVYQLFGGIQRYLEQFPDGGFFKGKNFVFDHRISVGSTDTEIIGSCLLCGSSFDDYNSRCRCAYCRMLVLVCNDCQRKHDSMYVCELCNKHGKSPIKVTSAEGVEPILDHLITFPEGPSVPGNICPKKLRILCLHGFRQNASSFKGRTSSLAKKLRSLVEFIFVNAPHELPFVYQPRLNGSKSPLEGFPPRQNTDIPNSTKQLPPLEKVKKKFAWLVESESNCLGERDWMKADEPFDPLQYQHQTEGFDESYAHLKRIFGGQGPFDGILGFSQGAAVAAMLCAKQRVDDHDRLFRFVILCSGFALSSMDVKYGSINCPSLHIFGSDRGNDRQISQQASMELTRFFEEGSSMVVEHQMGHIIPTLPPYIDQIKAFLQRFV
ncbi:rhodanese-like domain-containing protein 6 [Aristolochia californica]|uniref:rhodanese-like domain-containing protein 6 n=1 Tax=Aristolochia californica TaxID=171875 RepID=UPI0035DC3DBB